MSTVKESSRLHFGSFHCLFALTLRKPLLTTVLLATLVSVAHGQKVCKQQRESRPLAFGTLNTPESALSSLQCDFWRFQDKIQQDVCAPDSSGMRYLLFEFWRLNVDGSPTVDDRQLGNVFFFMARGAQPSVGLIPKGNSVMVAFSPTYQQKAPYTGINGTLLDEAALDMGRAYHRILVPVNASRTLVNGKPEAANDWLITVSNLETSQTPVPYGINVTCVTEETAPCPRPLPNAGPCSDRGICGPVATLPQPAFNKVCFCSGDWGDYGCQVPVRTLDIGTQQSAVLEVGAWAYWQFSVPRSADMSADSYPPTVLVELSRTYVGGSDGGFGTETAARPGWSWGGYPALIVMPKAAGDANRLPNENDWSKYGDQLSYALEQNLHYVMLRGGDALPVTLPGSAAAAAVGMQDSSEWYIAVLNSQGAVGANSTANITVRLRVHAAGAPGGASTPLCPGDCYGRGYCYDLGGGPLPSSPFNTGTIPDFMCSCNAGYTGTMCEGTYHDVAVSTAGASDKGTLQPSQWTYFLLNFDPRTFNYRSDDVQVQWVVQDKSSDPPTAYDNAFMTINKQAFPRAPLLDSSADFYAKGVLIQYSDLFQSGSGPKPMTMFGSDLKAGAVYVLGMYNSDYDRQKTYDYGVWVSVPSADHSWLHPYMSVVLGVTAAVFICLLLTLCRRLVQRYGWGPFRGGGDGGSMQGMVGGPGDMARMQMAQQMHVRPARGVPGHVLDTFHSYEYAATSAEKQQLARSVRDHQQQQLQQQQQGQQEQGQVAGGVDAPSLPTSVPASVVSAAAVVDVSAPAAAAPFGDRPGSARGVPGRVPSLVRSTDDIDAAGGAGGAGKVAAAAALPAPSGSGGGGGSSSGAGQGAEEDEEPQCTVCLCEYEEGERITRLPCKHEFHGTCITKWLQTHYTCPICRISLLPDEPDQPPEVMYLAHRAPTVPTGPGAPSDAPGLGAGAGAAPGQLQQLPLPPPPQQQQQPFRPQGPWAWQGPQVPATAETAPGAAAVAAAGPSSPVGNQMQAAGQGMPPPPPFPAGAVVAMPPPPLPRPPQGAGGGFMGRLLGGFGRSSGPTSSARTPPTLAPGGQDPAAAAANTARPAQTPAFMVPLVPLGGAAGSGATGAAGSGIGGGGGGAVSEALVMIPEASAASAAQQQQLIARGPTAALESPSARSSGGGAGNHSNNSGGGRAPSSPAGRLLGSGRVSVVPLPQPGSAAATDGDAAGAAVPPLRRARPTSSGGWTGSN